MKTVCIKMGDDGQVMVGLEPPGEEMAEGGMEGAPAEDESYLSPAGSVDEALQVAKDLLTNDQVPPEEGDAAFDRGYQKASGPQGVDMKGLM